MKKKLLGLGTIAAVAAPIAAVVSCGGSSHETTSSKKGATERPSDPASDHGTSVGVVLKKEKVKTINQSKTTRVNASYTELQSINTLDEMKAFVESHNLLSENAKAGAARDNLANDLLVLKAGFPLLMDALKNSEISLEQLAEIAGFEVSYIDPAALTEDNQATDEQRYGFELDRLRGNDPMRNRLVSAFFYSFSSHTPNWMGYLGNNAQAIAESNTYMGFVWKGYNTYMGVKESNEITQDRVDLVNEFISSEVTRLNVTASMDGATIFSMLKAEYKDQFGFFKDFYAYLINEGKLTDGLRAN